jgi:hypothetical protein
MTELEEQQQAEIKKLHKAVNKACTDFNTLLLEICEGNNDVLALETIFDELAKASNEVDRCRELRQRRPLKYASVRMKSVEF